jgi:DNA-directed RNA polymerase subunit RPC12/RpoP
MSIAGQCQKCGQRVLHVNVENVLGMVDGESKARCLSYSCIHCHAVLGVEIDPRAKPRPRRKPAVSTRG